MDETATIEAFVDAMASVGVNLDRSSKGGPHPVADGQLHRADALGKKSKRNQHIWYVLHIDEPSSGAFGDLQSGVQDTWTREQPQRMSAVDRDILKRRIEETRRAREAEQKALNEAAAIAAGRIMKATGKASPDHAYLARKGLPVFPGLRILKTDVRYVIEENGPVRTARAGVLVVPMFDAAGGLVGVQTINDKGAKYFLKGCAKTGSYHSIGAAPEPGGVILIAEGYATAARLHQAAGLLAVAAWDSGNLSPVAAAIAAKYPECRVVICADNDRHTHEPIENPGLTKAREAAALIGAAVAVPEFETDDLKSTDFDDLAQLRGLDAVLSVIDAALNPPDVEPRDGPPIDAYADMSEGPSGPEGMEYGGGELDAGPFADFGMPHFRALGIDGKTCFYQPSDVAQVISLEASSHKPENLMLLAPLQFWEFEFPGAKGATDWKAAVNACVRACKARRKFVPHNAVRGRGAWFEGKTPVYHAGERLIIDGEYVQISAHGGRFVYDEGDAIPVDIENPLTSGDARRLLYLCKELRWSNPLAGYLLAGWLVVAPVCGFLKWRPHIWINGPAGSGKSTVMDRIIKQVLSTTAHSVVGATTEAGIRGVLGMDALPIIFDESEPKDMQSQSRIRSILDLARVAASESDGLILKGTSNQKTKGYRARSMFVFASINTQIEGYADETRFTQLTLAAPRAETPEAEKRAREHYEKLVAEMVGLLTDDFSTRLMARTILHLPTLREYVRIFTAAAAVHLGTQRLGDQIGPMLAGAYLLNTTRELTLEKALAWIRENDISTLSAGVGLTDTERFVQHFTGYIVRHATPEGGTWERTIGELMQIAAYDPDKVAVGFDDQPNKKKSSAIAALARLGVAVYETDAGFDVAITTKYEGFRARILKGTEWAATDMRNLMKDIDGVTAGEGNRYFASGITTPFVVVPLEKLIGNGAAD
ncbi:toprim domain-containing protein [Breoghania sp.]|uniref:toprim domain-containing protein n=1 Tax=Breoghania sp. TaxID=2065378 RepID=UPI002AA74EE0|nr:toprim domain-containing protein [Breoghania sp.]